MRNIVSLFLFLCISLGLYAQNINTTEYAESFMKARAEGSAFEKKDFVVSESFSFRDKNAEEAVIVFNFESGGFLVLSAESAVYPVLAYSYQNTCDQDNLPFGFRNWIQDVVHQIEKVREHKLAVDARIQNAWQMFYHPEQLKDREMEGVDPLLTTTWNQGKYYNASCPDDPAGPDDHALTGCVATALGQLMNYFRYPQQGEGYYSYTDPTYGFLETNFSEQFYNWDAMGTDLNEYNPDVADLLHHIGVSVDMQYGPNGSGMYNHKGAYTLRTYFGYSDTTQYFFRDSLDESFDWPAMLIDHLDQHIPLYYAGWSDTIFQMGHAFIADGYEDSTYFHFNWGWGGSSDGYFNLNSLTPSGSDFTLLHEAIAYATPNGEYPVYCDGQKQLANLEGCLEDGSGPLNNYLSGGTCEWLIQPNDTVSYIEFNLLNCKLAPDDELIVYDGLDDSADVLASFTGENTAQSFESNGGSVLVRFVTEGTESDEGWMLSYAAVKPDFCSVISYVTDSSAIISDGSNAYPYHENTYCNWFITPEGAENIRIEFLEIDIADGDFLRIRDRANNETIGSFSGSVLPDVIDIISDDVSLTFDTDYGDVSGGWKIQYAMNVVSVEENQAFDLCEVYPNPAKGSMHLNIHLNGREALSLQLVSVDGKVVFEGIVDAEAGFNQIPLQLETLDSGFYLLHVSGESGDQIVKIQKL